MKERLAIWLAWKLPRSIAYWAYIRVATYKTTEAPMSYRNPTSQTIDEPMERWRAA